MLVIKQSKIHDSYTFVNLHPNKYSQELRYYTFAVNLDRYLGNCNTLDNLYSRVCFPNETKDLNLCFNYDNRNKQIKNIDKIYIM